MPKLDLTRAAIVSDKVAARLKDASDLLEEAEEYASELGVEKYPQPSSKPQPLSEIEAERLSNDDLAGLHARYVAYAQFVNYRLSVVTAAYANAISAQNHLKANLAANLYAKGEIAKTEVPALVKDDPLYQDYECEVLRLKCMKTVLEAYAKSYDKQAAAISRIISVREMELQQTLRDTNLPSRGKGKARAPWKKPQRPDRDFNR